MCVHMYVCVYIYIYMYVYVHTNNKFSLSKPPPLMKQIPISVRSSAYFLISGAQSATPCI